MTDASGSPRTTDVHYARVLAAEGISNFGSMLSRLAIPWLAALQLQATPGQMAGLLVADVLAAGLGALLLGGLVDRSSKRAVMVWADAARCFVLALLALGAWRGVLGMPLLWLGAAASGVLTVAFEMARSAWTAMQVPQADLARRNAQLSVAGSVSEALAFASGGWLFQALGAALALVVDALSYALSALCLRGVPPSAPVVQPAVIEGAAARLQAALDDARAGLRTVWHEPRLRALCIVRMLLDACMACAAAAYMIYVSRDLALPTGPLGMIFAVGALGAVAGAWLATTLGRRWGAGRTLAVGLLLLTLGQACVPLMAPGNAVALLVAALVLQQVVGDAGHTMADVHDRTLRQSAVASELLARADAGIRSAGHAATLLGAAVAGWLGDAHGARSVLWLAVLFAAAATAWAFLRLARHSGPVAA